MISKNTAICEDCGREVGYSYHAGSDRPLYDSHVDKKGEMCKGAGWHVPDVLRVQNPKPKNKE